MSIKIKTGVLQANVGGTMKNIDMFVGSTDESIRAINEAGAAQVSEINRLAEAVQGEIPRDYETFVNDMKDVVDSYVVLEDETKVTDNTKIFLDTDAGTATVELATEEELEKKTEKTRIDFDGTSFKIGDKVLNYKELYEIHIQKPDFAFVVYGDRAYLLSYAQDDAGMKEMRFESVIATTGSDNLSYVKTSGIYVISNDGVNIVSVKISDINSESTSYKANAFSDGNKNSEVWYPSNKAVTNLVSPIAENVAKNTEDITAHTDEIAKLQAVRCGFDSEGHFCIITKEG